MKSVYLATGAANMYCGSCMRDNTLAAALKGIGHTVTLLPLYTPMRLDEENVGEKHIFYGGLEAYVRQQFPQPSVWRQAMVRVARAQPLLHLMPRLDIGAAVDPVQNAELTLSMLRGEDGNQKAQLAEMLDWLEQEQKPDLVHVTNTLLSGLIPAIKKRLQVPIVCGLHGEDIFVFGLPEKYQAEALRLIHHNAAHVDQFISISQYYTDFFAPLAKLEPSRITLVPPGIALGDYLALPLERPAQQPPTIGYFARIAPEKGLHVLAEAFILLCASGEFPTARLRVAGYLSNAHAKYVANIRKRLQAAGVADRVEILGTLERPEKVAFLSSLDVFSVPTVYRDPKGLPVLEALASGVPVVQPAHGAFPELVQATGGGLLHQPEDPADLAAQLAALLRDPARRQQLATQGRAAVAAHFTATRMARETLAVYEKLVKK